MGKMVDEKNLQNGKSIQKIILSEKVSITSKDKDAYRSQKIAKTTCFVFVWICLGMAASIDGPCLPDLRERLGVEQEKLSLSLAFRSIGVPLGCILGGMLNDRYRRFGDLIGGIGLILIGVMTITKPHVYNLPMLGIVSFLNGFGHGAMDSVGHAGIAWMFPDNPGPPMSGIHMGYPIGNTLSPIIAMNFLSPIAENETLSTVYAASTTISPLKEYAKWNLYNIRESESVTIDISVTESDIVQLSRIEIPYGIIGSLVCVVAIVTLIFFIYEYSKGIKLYGESKESMKNVWSAKGFRSSNKSTTFTIVIIVLVCLMFGFIGGKDGTLDQFIFTYAVESELQFTKREASVFNTVYNAIGIFSRIIMIVVSLKCPIEVVLMSCMIINTTFTACLAFLGNQKRVYLWVFASLFKLFSAPVWPAAHIWTTRQIAYSSMILAFVQISSSLFSFFSEWFSGYLHDAYSPTAFVYYGMAMGFVMLVIMIILQTYASCYNKKHGVDSKKIPVDVWTVEGNKNDSFISIESHSTKL